MLIFIRQDIINALKKTTSINKEDADRVMADITCALIHNNHYIIVENFSSNSVKEVLQKILTEKNFNILNNLNQSDKMSVLEYVNVILVVSFGNINDLKGKIWFSNQTFIHYNPKSNKKLELCKEIHLITEYLNDGNFYSALGKRYLRNKFKKDKNLQIKLFNRNGGGKTIAEVYEQERDLGKHLCLTIVDSDKNHPYDDFGITAKELQNKEDPTWKYSEIYYMKLLAEIENLIPVKHYQNKYKDNKALIAFIEKCDWSFFDCKLGLRAGILKKKKCYDYWSGIVVNLPPFNDIVNMVDSAQVKSGFGERILSKFMNKGYETNLIGYKDQDLTNSQKTEYENIGKRVMSWGLSFIPSRI